MFYNIILQCQNERQGKNNHRSRRRK